MTMTMNEPGAEISGLSQHNSWALLAGGGRMAESFNAEVTSTRVPASLRPAPRNISQTMLGSSAVCLASHRGRWLVRNGVSGRAASAYVV